MMTDKTREEREDWPVVYSYSRAEAIKDGVLVDLTALFPLDTRLYKYPVACTHAVWSLIESACKETGEEPGAYVWDLCNMAIQCGRDITPQIRLFKCSVPLRPGCEREFKIQCGPGDPDPENRRVIPEPVLTIMFPDED